MPKPRIGHGPLLTKRIGGNMLQRKMKGQG